MAFDLHIKGGHVLDPGQGLDAPLDIAISGVKLRVTGPFVLERGEELIRLSAEIARENGVPFMAHTGNRLADQRRGEELARCVLGTFDSGDVLTHLCTPHAGGVLDRNGQQLT
jgi:dihydroorotase